MWGTKTMLEKEKSQGRFYLYLSASLDGLGIILLGTVLEVLLRLGIYFELLKPGLEWFIFMSLFCFGGAWALIKLTILRIKIRNHDRQS